MHSMLQFLREIFHTLEHFAKTLEYIAIFITLVATIYASRKVKAGAKDVKKLIDASERLKVQSIETASMLTEAADVAIERMRAAMSEDLQGASSPTQVEQDAAGAPRGAQASTTAPPPQGTSPAASNAVGDGQRQVSVNEHDAHRRWWQPVLDTPPNNSGMQPPKLYWKNNVRFPLPWPGTWLTVWRNETADGVCGVAISGKAGNIEELWRAIQPKAAELEAALPPGSSVLPGRFGIGLLKPNQEFKNDDERRAWMQTTLLAFLKVLVPRLRALQGKTN